MEDLAALQHPQVTGNLIETRASTSQRRRELWELIKYKRLGNKLMRFAGSEVSFSPQRFSGSGSGGASAAGSSTLSETFGSTRANAPKYDDIHNVNLQTRSNERQAAMEAEALVAGQGIQAAANVASAGIQLRLQLKLLRLRCYQDGLA